MKISINILFFIILIFSATTLSFSQSAKIDTPELSTAMQKYLTHFNNLLEILEKNEEDPVQAEKEFSEYQETHEKEMEKLLETVQTETDTNIELKRLFSREFQTVMRKVHMELRNIAVAAEKKIAAEKAKEKTELQKE